MNDEGLKISATIGWTAIGAFLMQFAAVVWYASYMNTRIAALEEFANTRRDMPVVIARIEEKIDYMQRSMAKIEQLLDERHTKVTFNQP